MSSIYVLGLLNNKFYVGKSNFPSNRILQHFENNGAAWTKLHKPIKVIQIIRDIDDFDESKYTKVYMQRFGIENVRGGAYVQINLPDYQIKALEDELSAAEDRCFNCKQKGHFVRQCKSPNISLQVESRKRSRDDETSVVLKKNSREPIMNIISEYAAGTFVPRVKFTEVFDYMKNMIWNYKETIPADLTEDDFVLVDNKQTYNLNCFNTNIVRCYKCDRKGHLSSDCKEEYHRDGYILLN